MILVSVIRPLCGLEPFLEECLDATFHLDCSGYEVIFCAEDPEDPAVIVARMVAERYQIPVTFCLYPNPGFSFNPKLNNMQKGWQETQARMVLFADSNCMLPPDAIQRMSAKLTGNTGIVCSPPLGILPRSFWAKVECATMNTFQAKWQLLVAKLGFGFCQGKAMMVYKKAFQEMGGMEALQCEPMEDAAATKVVRRHGLKVKLVKGLFEQPIGKRTFKQVLARQIRWAKLRRYTFPLFYIPEILTTIFPFLAAYAIFPAWWEITTIVLIESYMIEKIFALWMIWEEPTFVSMIVRDFMLMFVWFTGWFGKTIMWNGKKIPLNGTRNDLERALNHEG